MRLCREWPRWFLVVAAGCVAAACHNARLPTATVSGKVSYQGKPLIPEKYAAYVTSGLTFEVHHAGNQYIVDLTE